MENKGAMQSKLTPAKQVESMQENITCMQEINVKQAERIGELTHENDQLRNTIQTQLQTIVGLEETVKSLEVTCAGLDSESRAWYGEVQKLRAVFKPMHIENSALRVSGDEFTAGMMTAYESLIFELLERQAEPKHCGEGGER